MSRRVTQSDVARRAGVSRATVSNVLNNRVGGSVRIPLETRQRVLAAVEELGYQPHAAARSLRSGQSGTVGLLIPDATNPHFWGIVRGVEAVTRQHGYRGMGHAHGHAMVAGAGDYVWFSSGVVLEAKTGRYVCQWKAEDGQTLQSAKHLEATWIGDELVWAGQDEGHGFIYNDYPLDQVLPLLPETSPLKRRTHDKE